MIGGDEVDLRKFVQLVATRNGERVVLGQYIGPMDDLVDFRVEMFDRPTSTQS